MNQTNLTTLKELSASVPRVRLSAEGTFKYILIHLKYIPTGELAEFVRGDLALEYHNDNLKQFKKELASHQFRIQNEPLEEGRNVLISCPGGGRVEHSVSKQFLKIYGYSQSFGQADHNHVVELIKDHLNYPKYEVSFEGY